MDCKNGRVPADGRATGWNRSVVRVWSECKREGVRTSSVTLDSVFCVCVCVCVCACMCVYRRTISYWDRRELDPEY